MSTKQKKTIIRTVRLTRELNAILEKDAELQRTNFNALISSILTKYAEWDRYAERFGHISIPQTLFRAILDLTDENALATLAERLGVELTNEIVSFWFKKTSEETLLKFLSIVCEYGKAGRFESEVEGRDRTFNIRHDYGKKWSTFLEHYSDKAIRNYSKVMPQFETTDSAVTVRFRVNP